MNKNNLEKKDILDHRNNSHKIFLTVITILITFGSSNNGEMINLTLVLLSVYFLVILFNLECEFRNARKCTFPGTLRRSITLIIPISFIVFQLSNPDFKYNINLENNPLYFLDTIITAYFVTIVVLFSYLKWNKNKK